MQAVSLYSPKRSFSHTHHTSSPRVVSGQGLSRTLEYYDLERFFTVVFDDKGRDLQYGAKAGPDASDNWDADSDQCLTKVGGVHFCLRWLVWCSVIAQRMVLI
jgi:hypothetical protein